MKNIVVTADLKVEDVLIHFFTKNGRSDGRGGTLGKKSSTHRPLTGPTSTTVEVVLFFF